MTGVISGWKSNTSQKCILEHLKFDKISLGSDNKLSILINWCKELNISLALQIIKMKISRKVSIVGSRAYGFFVFQVIVQNGTADPPTPDPKPYFSQAHQQELG